MIVEVEVITKEDTLASEGILTPDVYPVGIVETAVELLDVAYHEWTSEKNAKRLEALQTRIEEWRASPQYIAERTALEEADEWLSIWREWEDNLSMN